jgi:sulfur carrier protein
VKIVLNGDVREVTGARTIAELVAELALPVPATLIEHNGLALRRDEWPDRPLAEGDRLEAVRIVAGG